MKLKTLLFPTLAPVVVAVLQYYLWPFISPFVWFLFFPTVFFAARFDGLRGAMICAVVSALIVWYVFIPPQFSWELDNPYNLYSIVLFLIMGYFFGDSQQKLRKAHNILEAALNQTNQENQKIASLYRENLALDEIKFTQLANSLPQIVWVTTPEGKNVFFNQQWYQYTGMSTEESMGDGWNKPFHPDDRARAWEAWSNAVNNRGEYSLECRLRRADGEYRWWLIRGIPAFNLNFEIEKWFATCTDIHEIKIIEESERASKATLLAAIDSLSDAIFISDKDGNFINFNHAFATFHKFKSKEDCPKSLSEYPQLIEVLSENQEPVTPDQWVVSKALKGEPGFDLELNLKRKDTDERWIGSFNYAPILNKEQEITGTVVIARDITEKKKIQDELESYLHRLEATMEDTLFVLSKAVDMRDPYTSGHQQRVGILAEEIGKKLKLSSTQSHNLNLIGLIHDIGKIGIPAELLAKPNKLNQIEYELVKTHVTIGYDILKGVNFLIPVAEIVHEHHERLDGSGYPMGLKGDEILFEARILAVADVVEAMSSHRPYRPALGMEKALAEIEAGRGTKYDPLVVDACLELFREDGYKIPQETDSLLRFH